MKKIFTSVLLSAVFMLTTVTGTGMTTSFAAETDQNVQVQVVKKVSGVEFGVEDAYQTKNSNMTYYRLEYTGDAPYTIHIFSEKNGKVVRIKKIPAKRFSKKSQAIFVKSGSGSQSGVCLSYDLNCLYVPILKNNNMNLYRISLKSGKCEKIFSKKKLRTGKQTAAYAVFANGISERYISLRVGCSDEEKFTNVFYLYDLKKNKIVKKTTAHYKVTFVNDKYICGFEFKANGKLCIQKWGGKIKKVEVDNPSDGTDGNNTYNHSQYSRLSKNNLYYTTRAGLFSYNMKTGKITSCLKINSVAPGVYQYICGLNPKKNSIGILTSGKPRSDYRYITVNLK